MHDHVYRTVLVGTGAQAINGSSRGLLFHPSQPTEGHYTGMIIVTPEARLAVLEGATSQDSLHRDALALAGLDNAQTLLSQRSTFRWFSALLLQHFPLMLPDFTLESLTRLCNASPRQLCSYISTLALRAQNDITGTHRQLNDPNAGNDVDGQARQQPMRRATDRIESPVSESAGAAA